MIDLRRIFPECYTDTLLVELIFKRGKPVHFHNISKVAAALSKWGNDEAFVIGLVDDDKLKNVPPYLKDFKIVTSETNNTNLRILQKEKTKKHLITLCPAFEKWIWSAAENCGIDPNEYGFSTWDILINYKVEIGCNNVQFKKFVNKVIAHDPPAIQTLRDWLSKAL